MRFRTLHLNRIGRLRDVEVDLPAPDGDGDLQLIVGANGAGKSTTLQAIRCFLFGFPRQAGDLAMGDDQSAMSVGMTIESDAGQRRLTRHKRDRDSLVDADAHVLAEQTIVDLTGGVGEGRFDEVYGIGHAELRLATEYLKGKHDLGELVFGAATGMLGGPYAALQAAREEAELLVTSGDRTRSGELWKKAGELEALTKSINKHAVKPKEYEAIEVELDTARTRRDALQRVTRSLEALGSLVAIVSQVAPPVRERLRAAEAQLAGLADTFPALEHAGRIEALGGRVGELRTAMRSLRGDAADVVASAGALEIEVPELPVEDAGEDELVRACSALAIAAREGAHRLHEQLPARAALEAALGLVDARQQAENQIQAAIEQRDQQRVRLEQAEADRDGLPPLPEWEAQLKAMRDDLHRQGDLEEKLVREIASRDELRRRFDDECRSLNGVGSRAAFDALTGVPEGRIAHDLADRIGSSRDNVARARRELDEARTKLVELGVGEPDPQGRDPLEVLQGARRHRDEGWRIVRAALDGSPAPDVAGWPEAGGELATAFERAVIDADDAADRYVISSQHADRLAAVTRAELKLAEAAGALDTLVERWAELWSAAPVSGLDEAQALVWGEQVEAIRKGLANVQAMDDTIELLRGTTASFKEPIIEALAAAGEIVPAAATSAALLEIADRRLDQAQQVRGVHAAARGVLEAALAAVEQADHGLEQARDHSRDLDGQWGAAMLAIAMDQAAEAVAVRKRCDEMLRMHDRQGSLHRAASSLREKVDMVIEIAGEAGEVVSLLADAQVAVDGATAADRIDRLSSMLTADRERRAQRDAASTAVATDRSTLQEHAAKARTHLKSARTVVADIADAGLPLLGDVGNDGAAQLAHALISIEVDGDDELLDAMCEVAEASEPAAAMSLADAIDTIDREAGPRLDDALAAWARAHEARERLDGSDEHARMVAECSRLEAEVIRMSERYRVVRTAEVLIAKVIREYNQANQSQVLADASDIVERLTDGELPGLRARDNSDGVGKTLVVLRRRVGSDELMELDPGELSDGERDLVFLALRLAAIGERRSSGGERLPLVLDDVLVHLDDERAAGVLGALRELSRTGQVIVFTHHEHVAQLAVQRAEESGSGGVAVHQLLGAARLVEA